MIFLGFLILRGGQNIASPPKQIIDGVIASLAPASYPLTSAPYGEQGSNRIILL